MTFEVTREFAEKFGRKVAMAWEKKDVDAAVELFKYAECYMETPFAENAAKEKSRIRQLWQQTLKQTDIKILVEVLAVDNADAVIKYEASYSTTEASHETSGIWVVHFQNNVCVSFRQWFNERPRS